MKDQEIDQQLNNQFFKDAESMTQVFSEKSEITSYCLYVSTINHDSGEHITFTSARTSDPEELNLQLDVMKAKLLNSILKDRDSKAESIDKKGEVSDLIEKLKNNKDLH